MSDILSPAWIESWESFGRDELQEKLAVDEDGDWEELHSRRLLARQVDLHGMQDAEQLIARSVVIVYGTWATLYLEAMLKEVGFQGQRKNIGVE